MTYYKRECREVCVWCEAGIERELNPLGTGYQHLLESKNVIEDNYAPCYGPTPQKPLSPVEVVAVADAKPENKIKHSAIILLRCSCGQMNWVPNYDFNRNGGLEYGTPYRCCKCTMPLGSEHIVESAESGKEPSK